LAQVDASRTNITTSIASLHWISTPASPPINGLHIDSSPSQPSLVSGTTNSFTAAIMCTVAPAFQPTPSVSKWESPIDSVVISYIVIFYPKTS
jgi:hypothetical protein